MKITLPSDILNKDSYNIFSLTVVDPQGATKTARLTSEQAQGIIAATCTKHRTRMMTQYYHSEKRNYLVCGTTNKSEAIQGLFVKYGDGGVDIEPIAHLFKTQVRAVGGLHGRHPRDRRPRPLSGHLQRPGDGRGVVLPDAVRCARSVALRLGEQGRPSPRSAGSWVSPKTRSSEPSGISRASTTQPNTSGGFRQPWVDLFPFLG